MKPISTAARCGGILALWLLACSTPLADEGTPTAPLERGTLLQFHWKGKGGRVVTYGQPMTRGNHTNHEGDCTIRGRLSSGGSPCDEAANLFGKELSFQAKGKLIRREDGLAQFKGDIVFTGDAKVEMFRGTLVVIDRVGSHTQPHGAEHCAAPGHVEGYLYGNGVPKQLANIRLDGLFVATGKLPEPSPKASDMELGEIVLVGSLTAQ